MAALIYPFLVIASAGFVAMLVVHISALLGNTYLFDHSLRFLAPGLFIAFLPMIFVMNRLTRDFKQKDVWRAALRGCPQWMYRTVWVIFGYAWVGFFVIPLIYGGGMDSAANKARSMTGVLLVFYLLPAAVLYSATKIQQFDEGRRCLNGHRVSPLAKFCDECGAPVVTSTGESPL